MKQTFEDAEAELAHLKSKLATELAEIHRLQDQVHDLRADIDTRRKTVSDLRDQELNIMRRMVGALDEAEKG